MAFDRDRFLASFRRQAQWQLVGCLQREMTSGSLLLAATLDPAGKLRNVRTVGGVLPTCAKSDLVQMRFVAISQHLPTAGIEVKWRVDF